MTRKVPLLCAAMTLAFAGAASAADIEVMTQNQYLGANLDPIIEAGQSGDLVALNAAVINALVTVAGNLPQQRFEALGALIAKRKPHLVGLQEVFEYSCLGVGCSDDLVAGAFNDHLGGTVDALDGAYVPVATIENLNITLPIMTPSGGALVTVRDRDVILARSDIAAGATPVTFSCTFPSAVSDGCNFAVVGEVKLAGQTVRVERGYVGVDVTIGGKDYRFVNTHLEVRTPEAGNPLSRTIQSRQADELIRVVVNTVPDGRELILVGDINSAPTDEVLQAPLPLPPEWLTPAYMQLTEWAGLTDTWMLRPGSATGRGAPLVGFSCCQDEDLGNRHSKLEERIDVIFTSSTPKKVQDARLLGEVVGDKTMPNGFGLWPSDHASVAAKIQY
jgi:endonuclease/exonuclease/phosphatase family metal-dependent hydrolase